jgi:hypothetical protein
MTYIDVITLVRTKNYLRLDTGFTKDDAEITSMINGACKFVEMRTNIIFFDREKSYIGLIDVVVYDFPINELISPIDAIPCYFSTSIVYPNQTNITLNVGYANPLDVPDDLIQACLQMIKVWYYESEKQVNITLIPMSVMQVIDINRRFI